MEKWARAHLGAAHSCTRASCVRGLTAGNWLFAQVGYRLEVVKPGIALAPPIGLPTSVEKVEKCKLFHAFAEPRKKLTVHKRCP